MPVYRSPYKESAVNAADTSTTLPVRGQGAVRFRGDLQGTWSNGTITPLERPSEFAHQTYLSSTQATEYERTWLENFRKNFSEEDLMAPDLDYTIMDRQKVVPSRRTSLVTDPPDGRLPPLLPAAKARADARPKKSNDDPEVMGMAERCLMETSFGASPLRQ